MSWGPAFLECPGNLPGPISIFLNIFFRRLHSDTQTRFKNLIFKAKQSNLLLRIIYHQRDLSGPVSYRDFRETGPWSVRLGQVIGKTGTICFLYSARTLACDSLSAIPNYLSQVGLSTRGIFPLNK